jgi:D-alanyl-D-alanine carboxypeptidase
MGKLIARRPRALFSIIVSGALAVALFSFPATAQFPPSNGAVAAADRDHHRHHQQALTDPAQDAALVIDGKTGTLLYARNEKAQRHPASLTKMMTLYLIFERLRLGQLQSSTEFPVSINAARQAPIKLHLHAGSKISVDAAIQALAVCSANDVAVAAAEGIAGTEQKFARLMNAKAQQLGMTQTFFRNASGLPDDQQLTTARDLAKLAQQLVYTFPEYMHYFRMKSYSDGAHHCETHDSLIETYQGADGIKTGYTDASGYNIVSTAVRNGTRVIAVVMGGLTKHKRDRAVAALLDLAFAQVDESHQSSTRVSAK